MTRTVSLRDRFGDNGLISVVLGKIEGDVLDIDTWLMSCRVLKRGVEQFLLNHLVDLRAGEASWHSAVILSRPPRTPWFVIIMPGSASPGPRGMSPGRVRGSFHSTKVGSLRRPLSGRLVPMDATLSELEDVFRQVFDDDAIVLEESTTADDIDGWDSMMHINLIIALEKRFKVKFAAAEIAGLKAEGQDVGALVRLLERKVQAAGTRP